MCIIDRQSNLRRNVIALCAMTFCYSAFQGICQTIVPLSMDHFHFTKVTIGVMQAVPGIMALAFGAILARLGNGRWRRETLMACFVMTVVASLLYAKASRPAAFVVPQLLYGISSTAYWSNSVATSLQLAREPGQQAGIQAKVTAAQGIGAFAGPMLGGYLSNTSFFAGFLAGVLCAVVGFAANCFLDRSVPIEASVGPREFVLGAYVKLWRLVTRQPIVILGMAFVSLNCFLMYVMGGSFYLLYASQIGLTAFVAAALVSGRDAIGAVMRIGFGKASQVLSPIAMLGIGSILGAVSLGLLPLAQGIVGASVVALASGVFLAFLPPAVNMLIGANTAPDEQSFAIVGMHSSNFIAQTTMSPLLGLLLTRHSYSTVYPVVAAVFVVVAGLVLRAGLRLQHRSVVAEAAVPAQ